MRYEIKRPIKRWTIYRVDAESPAQAMELLKERLEADDAFNRGNYTATPTERSSVLTGYYRDEDELSDEGDRDLFYLLKYPNEWTVAPMSRPKEYPLENAHKKVLVALYKHAGVYCETSHWLSRSVTATKKILDVLANNQLVNVTYDGSQNDERPVPTYRISNEGIRLAGTLLNQKK